MAICGLFAATAQVRAADDTPVSPMLTTHWSLMSPYNVLCPEIDGVHCSVGCVALAMGQILNFNEFPDSATFSGGYYLGASLTRHTVEVNDTYHWPYADVYATEQEAAEGPAQMLNDCGYAVDMSYGYLGTESAASMDMAAKALINFFGYPEEAVKYFKKAYFTKEEWHQLVADELQRNSPILYSAVDSAKNFPHAFVLHGLDASGSAYINWGWGGYYDGYFDLDDLQVAGYTLMSNQDMIVGIRPNVLSADTIRSVFCTDKPYTFEYINEADSFILSINADVTNLTPVEYTGHFAIKIIDETAGTVIYDDLLEGATLTTKAFGVAFKPQAAGDTRTFDNGHTYLLSLVTKDERESAWQPIRTIGGPISYKLTVDDQGDVSIESKPIYTNIKQERLNEQESRALDGVKRYYTLDGREVGPSAKGLIIVKEGSRSYKIFR